MKREKFIIRPGKICTLDAKNVLKQNCTGVVHVEVLEKIKYRGIVSGRWWKVVGSGLDNNVLPDPITVPENLLQPSGMAVIRYPSDFPIINNKDVDALDFIINAFDQTPKNNQYVLIPNKTNVDINRLKALREKLALSVQMNEV